MEIINFADRPSLVSRYMRELRDVNIQNDPLRFRSNLRRIGQIMAYEISKRLDYSELKSRPRSALAFARNPPTSW